MNHLSGKYVYINLTVRPILYLVRVVEVNEMEHVKVQNAEMSCPICYEEISPGAIFLPHGDESDGCLTCRTCAERSILRLYNWRF